MREADFVTALIEGELEVTGRLIDASNATLYGRIKSPEFESAVVYKPIAGERPLWDFPTGTLAFRERAAFLLSEAIGAELVPATVLRDGPFGRGAVIRWIDIDEEIDLISFGQSDDPRLRRMALFDAIVNNTDRKFGHILATANGALFGCDHGVTFHSEPKLRTVLWQFAGTELTEGEFETLKLAKQWCSEADTEMFELLSSTEIAATVARIEALEASGIFPYPPAEWPAVPWPPV